MDTLFKALNDPTRRRILELLRERDIAAGEIAEQFHMSKPSISHHLDLLRQADLVLAERRGQFIVYSLNTTVLDDCVAWLLKLRGKAKKGIRHELAEKRMGATDRAGRTLLRRRAALG